MVLVGQCQRKEPAIVKYEPYSINDPDNLELLEKMIAAEKSGIANAIPEYEDVEMAVVVAAFIKQIINSTHTGCIIRGECE
jgi:hypothetical protein